MSISNNTEKLRIALEKANVLPEDKDKIMRSIIDGTITKISSSKITCVGSNAFTACYQLSYVNLPNCISINDYAFQSCPITSVSFPACANIGNFAFQSCPSLTSVNFPICTSIGSYAFYGCSSLTSANFPVCRTISINAFRSCTSLISLYLTGSSLCTLLDSSAFASTPIGGYSTSAGRYGSIYVPQSLFTSYKTATNWTYFSKRFVGV